MASNHACDSNSGNANKDGLGWLPQGLRSALNLDKKNSKTSNSDSIRDLFQRVERELNIILDGDDQKQEEGEKNESGMEKCLSEMKSLLFEETNNNNNGPDRNNTVALEILKSLTASTTSSTTTDDDDDEKDSSCLLELLLIHLAKLPFESRKDVASIFNNLLCHQEEMVVFIENRYLQIMRPLVHGHTNIQYDVALHCGSMFRTTLQHLTLYQRLLSPPEHASQLVYPFLDTLVHIANFEIASDALETLRCILTGNSNSAIATNNNINNAHNVHDANYSERMETINAQFLETHYQQIFVERFNPKLLLSTSSTNNDNYITRRVSLQLLTSILLTRANYNVMIQYISSRSNLKTIMMLLRDPSPHITLDAFHVFKIFVANPSKPPDITKVLLDNQVKLVKYLETLHSDRERTDEQFRDEKALVIATLQGLHY